MILALPRNDFSIYDNDKTYVERMEENNDMIKEWMIETDRNVLDVISYTQELPSKRNGNWMVDGADEVLQDTLRRMKFHAMTTKGYESSKFDRSRVEYFENPILHI